MSRNSQSSYTARSATDTIAPMSDTQPKRGPSRTTKIVVAVAALLLWTGWASQWNSKGCDFILDSYVHVLMHGTPDRNEGCEDRGVVGPEYTDDYRD